MYQRNRSALILAVATGLVMARIGRADDRDLLFVNRAAAPNVLIILDSSGSMNDDFTDTYNYAAWQDDPRSKIQTAKRVLSAFLPGVQDVNFGFSTYHSGQVSERSLSTVSGGTGNDNGEGARKSFLYYAGNQVNASANPWSGSTNDTKGIQLTTPLQFGGNTPFGDATCTDISGLKYASTAPNCPTGQTGFRQFYSSFGYTGTGTVNYLGNATGTNCTGASATNTCTITGTASHPWCTYQTTIQNGSHQNKTTFDKCRMDLTFVKKTGGSGIGDYGDAQIQVHEVVKHYPCAVITGSGSSCTTFSTTATPDPARTYDIAYNRATDSADPNWDGSFVYGYDAANNGGTGIASPDMSSPSPCSSWQSELTPLTGVNDVTSKPLIPIKTDAGNSPLTLTYVDPGGTTRAGTSAFLRRTSSVVSLNKSNYTYTISGSLTSAGLKEITNIAWANGSTPLGGALNSAKTYFSTDSQFTTAGDPLHACRKNYIILITDGLETCQSTNTPCTAATALKALGIPVFVIGLGIDQTDGNTLECIADNSAPTGSKAGADLFLPSDEAGLVGALTQIFNELDQGAKDFATLSVPSIQTSSESVAYFSTFDPRNDRSIWSGHIRSYILDTSNGVIDTDVNGNPVQTPYVFGTSSTPASGNLIADAGNSDSTVPGITGDLEAGSGGRINPKLVLAAGTSWSDGVHDLASGVVGRNLFFGLPAGTKDSSNNTLCASTTYECLVQIPAGTGGNNSTEPYTVATPPSTFPVLQGASTAWWNTVRDSTLFADIPNPLPSGQESTRDQALQNSFSFIRGDRDPVVESLKLSNLFTATNTTCASLTPTSAAPDSPCYYGDVLGDIFHGNPVIVSAPNNVAFATTTDPATVTEGVYSNRTDGNGNNASYRQFVASYAHRRKILYVPANDGFLHAFDEGVFGADHSSYNDAEGNPVALSSKYSLGSAREIFGFAPRTAVQKFYQLAHTTQQDWTVDGPPTVSDVFIDATRVGSSSVVGVVSSDGCGVTTCGPPPSSNAVWRTILIGTEREGGVAPTTDGSGHVVNGGGSIFCLDVTDPDKPAHMSSTNNGVIGAPECLVNNFTPGTTSVTSGCNAPYPRILWELRDDQVASAIAQTGVAGQAEKTGGNEANTQDLGYTWSTPKVGRIKVLDTATGFHKDLFVAVFGGGYIHTGPSLANVETGGDTGNFLYMVDVETGKVIYKRELGIWNSGAGSSSSTSQGNLEAGLPGSPAVIDADGNGYVDHIYIGDSQGRIWKVDTSTVPSFTSNVIVSSAWVPTLFFDEYQNSTAPSGTARQPIFSTPVVYVVGTTSTGALRLGVGVGTGDRDNMPTETDVNPNYFMVIVDDPTFTYPSYINGPTVQSLTSVSETSTSNCSTANSCFSGTGRGYYLTLQTTSKGAEIVNGNAALIRGLFVFPTFLGIQAQTQTSCTVQGSAFIHVIFAGTGTSEITTSGGTPLSPTALTGGVQEVSSPTIYVGPDDEVHVVQATSTAQQVQPVVAVAPPVNLKAWREQ